MAFKNMLLHVNPLFFIVLSFAIIVFMYKRFLNVPVSQR